MARETEKHWQRFVMDLAAVNGWMVAHFRPALTAAGNWVTPVAGNGKGFPDLVLVRERVVYAELKSETGRLTLDQEIWIDALKLAGAETYVWRPCDELEVIECLGTKTGVIVPNAGRRDASTRRTVRGGR